MHETDAPPGILTEDREGILVITLNRPRAYNAFDRRQSVRLAATLDAFDADPDLRCAVLTGADGRFCAGTDLKAAAAGESVEVEPRGFYGMLEVPPAKPLIAAVEGYALGGGWELAMACDLTIASTAACFGMPEVARGVVAAGGGLHRLTRRAPYHVALDWLLTGREVPAAEAERWGLVAQLVPPGEALERAVAVARTIAANGPQAVRATKQGVVRALDRDEPAAWALSREIVERISGSDEMVEGTAAFLAKRAPRWTR